MVVHPQSTEDVSKIVKIAVKHKVPVMPYSGGTSLEGNFRAVSVLSASRYLKLIQWGSTPPAGYASTFLGWTRF
jgi:FAD/FMN-containing dehydrogenase